METIEFNGHTFTRDDMKLLVDAFFAGLQGGTKLAPIDMPAAKISEGSETRGGFYQGKRILEQKDT